jgi:hypothetical protein
MRRPKDGQRAREQLANGLDDNAQQSKAKLKQNCKTKGMPTMKCTSAKPN